MFLMFEMFFHKNLLYVKCNPCDTVCYYLTQINRHNVSGNFVKNYKV
jgi:hypothetical protein